VRDAVLSARDVRRDLAAAVGPVVARVVAGCPGVVVADVVVAIQVLPLTVRIFHRAPVEGERPRAVPVELARVDGARVEGLPPAVEAFVAGALAGMTPSDVDATVAAMRGAGRLALILEPLPATVRLVLVNVAASFDEGVVLASIVDAQPVSH
jgi:hypothetical protein